MSITDDNELDPNAIEPTDDELWAQSQADEATASVDELPAQDEPQDETTPPDDTAPTEDDDGFSKYLPQITKHLEENVLPQYRDQWLREAMKRTRESSDAREKRINERFAPVLALIQKQKAAGFLSDDDALAQAQEAHRELAAQEDTQARQVAAQQAEWETKQAWLAQQQTQNPQATAQAPAWAASWEKVYNQTLQNSGLQEGDPELETIPLEISDADPQRGLVLLQTSIAEAVKTKQQRIKDTPPKKQATLRNLPDMGTGAGAGGINPLANIEDTDQLWGMSRGG